MRSLVKSQHSTTTERSMMALRTGTSIALLALATPTLLGGAWIQARGGPAANRAGPDVRSEQDQGDGPSGATEEAPRYPLKYRHRFRPDENWVVDLNLWVTGLVTTVQPFRDIAPGEPLIFGALDLRVYETEGKDWPHQTFALSGLQGIAPDSNAPYPVLALPPPITGSITPKDGRTWGTLRSTDDLDVRIELIPAEKGDEQEGK